MRCSYWLKNLAVAVAFFVLVVSGYLFWALLDKGDLVGGSSQYVVVLGGGLSGERTRAACDLFKQGHGFKGVVLTGGNSETFVADRVAFAVECGIDRSLLIEWPETRNSQEEIVAVRDLVRVDREASVVVVSDFLHLPRLRFLHSQLGLGDRVQFAPSVIGGRYGFVTILKFLVFCFREPVAYFYSRLVFRLRLDGALVRLFLIR